MSASPASRSFTVDVTAPTATIDSGPSGLSNSTSASFGFSSEAGATFECAIDSGAFAACTSPKSYTSLTETSHTFQVRATDLAGNTGTPASRSFTLDVTAPSATIDSGP